ncbi:sugar ABC transporter substrate-binding protein [Solirubrobacter sp. CPCC 204708]|uniref:Sugar ABC transporter substrate-binding protein n=1 Tax=Solirubrobacter deserti TaxID=2282478 RepID=A0ABT4RJ32_9ACTN|nr:sugar ABC transporter substrate-binding protein [Solirubrobacter deserti]MBE2317620.1 sugar ABC transporter substrate-binding protein [Solirubrobacter deserti]MDA0138569.1 sugar ABC transporter substrate-binding protein [Solirubrobacter deserti]
MPKRLAVAVAATALALAACGGEDNSSTDNTKAAQGEALQKGVTLTLWTMPNSPQPKEDLQKMVAPFTAKTGVKVDVQEVGWDVQFDRIRNAAVAGEGPDITQAGTTQVPFFAALGGFMDLSDRVEEIGGKAAYAEGIWNTTQVQGQEGTWAVPWFTEARSIYYRKDVLEKAGVDPATAFQDLDSFKATLQAIKDKVPDIEPFGAPGKKAYDLVHQVMPFVWDNGGAELSADAKQSTINSPESQAGVEFMGDLITSGLFDKSQLERDGTQVENQFKGGRLAVWIGGPWVLGSIDRAEDDTWSEEARANVGVAPMPTGPGGKAYTFVGGSDLMVFKNTKYPNEAWALVKFLSSDQTQIDYAKLLGMFPARLDPQQQVGDSSENHKAFFQAIQSGRTYAPIPQWGQIENAYKTRFGNILDSAAGVGTDYSAATVKSQLDAAAKEADGLLAQSAG